jgi:hypothetical protein
MFSKLWFKIRNFLALWPMVETLKRKFGLSLESCTNMGILIFRGYLVSWPISA